MEQTEAHGVLLSWDGESRLLIMRFHDAGSGAPEAAARELVDVAERWVGRSPAPFAMLVDCTNIMDTSPGWRAVWADFFKRHLDVASIAWYNANALIRATIMIFLKATRVRGAAFRREDDARAWLAAREAHA